MILTLILLLAMTVTAILVVKKKSKKQESEVSTIEHTDQIEIDSTPADIEKSIPTVEEKSVDPIIEVKEAVVTADQPKKKRKYHKKKHPKKMDANKK